MFLNEQQSLVQRTYRLWGELYLNGVPVRGGATNISRITAPFTFTDSSGNYNVMTVTDTGITIEDTTEAFEVHAKGGIRVDGRFVVFDNSNVTRLNILNNSVFLAVPVNITNSAGSANVMRVTDQGVEVTGSLTINNTNLNARLTELENDVETALNGNGVFPELDDNAYTRNAIGQIAANTTVATLRNAYPTVSDILAAMLDIETIMVAKEFKYYYVIPNPNEFEITQTQPISLQIDVDRGVWSPTQASGSVIPYGLPSNIAGFSLNGTNFTWDTQGANPNLRVVRYTSLNAVNYTFSTLTTLNVQNGSVTLPAGNPAYNASNVESITTQIVLSAPTNSLSFRSFAYVYVGTNDNGTTVNPDGNQRVYDTTTSIVVNYQPQNSNVYVYKQPSSLQVLDVFDNQYYTQTQGQFWTTTSFTRTTAPAVVYWRVSFVNNTVPTTQTIRILF